MTFAVVIQDSEVIRQDFEGFPAAFEAFRVCAMGGYQPRDPFGADIHIVDDSQNTSWFGAFVRPGDRLRVVSVDRRGSIYIQSAADMDEAREIMEDNPGDWMRVEALP